MAVTGWLIDKSALVRLQASADAAQWAARIERDRGQHRAPSIPDLIIAATAELAGLTVLHLDKDFEIIAGITGPPPRTFEDQLTQTLS
jgi:predicted nucleic acid-binding protein